MATNRYVNTQFWEDNYVLNLDPSEKLLFIYFLTNSRTNIAGIYEISMRKVSMETGFDKDMIEKILLRFTSDQRIYYLDDYIVVRNFIKHQKLNPSIEKGIYKEITRLPERLQKFIKLDERGLWFDAAEVGGKLMLLSSSISEAWLKKMQEQDKQRDIDKRKRAIL